MSTSSARTPLSSYLSALILLVLPVYYWRFSFLHVPTNLLEVLVVVLVLLVLYERRGSNRSMVFPYWQPAGLMLLGLIIASLHAPDKRVAFGIVKGWFIIPIIFSWVIANITSQKTNRLLLWALYGNVIAVSLYTIFQRYGIIPLVGYQRQSQDLMSYVEQGRALAFFESPNFVAMYLVPPAILLFITLKNQWVRLSLIVSLIAVYLSHSRAGIITIFTLGVLALFGYLWRKQRALAWLGLGVAGLLLAWYLTSHVNFQGVDTLRLGIWQVALMLILAHPLWGIGPGQFLTYFQSSHIVSSGIYREALQYALHPHNLYLNIWLSGGLLAVIGFIYLVTQARGSLLAARAGNSRILASGAAWALGAILIHGLLDSTYFKNDLALLAWFFLAMLFVSGQEKQA